MSLAVSLAVDFLVALAVRGSSIPYLLATADQLKGRQSKAGNCMGAHSKYQAVLPASGGTGLLADK